MSFPSECRLNSFVVYFYIFVYLLFINFEIFYCFPFPTGVTSRRHRMICTDFYTPLALLKSRILLSDPYIKVQREPV